MLNELNDIEIVILISESYDRFLCHEKPEVTQFFEKHDAILREPILYMGSTETERDKHALYHTHRAHLVSMGLLRCEYKKPSKGELPEFDNKTGGMKATGYQITHLGKLLLKNIDQEVER